ncbi:MAG TPA: hypothetical protein VFZ66_04965 [Herpetosiphonaceae bacterium]
MTERAPLAHPTIGMTYAFVESASQSLAGIPGKVIQVWPRFQSGDCLVTLEYPKPIKFRNALITRVDAFVSQLRPINDHHFSYTA